MTPEALYLAGLAGVTLLVLCGLTWVLERLVGDYFDYLELEEN